MPDARSRVGYKSPPIVTRFKKGQSGNPSGKPRKTADKLDLGRILQAIDHEEMAVEIDGKSRRMLKVEIHFRQLFNKAIRGNLREARLIAEMAGTYFGPEAEAYIRQIYTMALGKDHGAARLLDRLRKQFPGDLLPGDTITYLISESDAKL
jgi:hypothetical protein